MSARDFLEGLPPCCLKYQVKIKFYRASTGKIEPGGRSRALVCRARRRAVRFQLITERIAQKTISLTWEEAWGTPCKCDNSSPAGSGKPLGPSWWTACSFSRHLQTFLRDPERTHMAPLCFISWLFQFHLKTKPELVFMFTRHFALKQLL